MKCARETGPPEEEDDEGSGRKLAEKESASLRLASEPVERSGRVGEPRRGEGRGRGVVEAKEEVGFGKVGGAASREGDMGGDRNPEGSSAVDGQLGSTS